MNRTVATILGITRTVIFLAGILLGLTYTLALGLASAAGQFVGVFGGLGLVLAAPLCWIAAVRTKAGDRLTLAYFVACCVLIGAAYVVGTVEEGKQVQSGNAFGFTALALVAVIYLVIVPLTLHRYRERSKPDRSSSGVTASSRPPW